MRAEISLTVTPSDRRQLKALVRDHNAPQKHFRRAEIVLLTAVGVGTIAADAVSQNTAAHSIGLFCQPDRSPISTVSEAVRDA